MSNPYGEYHNSSIQGVINVVLRKILKGEDVVVWGDGRTVRDYIYVKDVAGIIVKLMEAGVSDAIVNIGSGSGTSINEILERIRQELGVFQVSYREARTFDVPEIILDTTRLRSYVPHVLTPMSEGLRMTIDWLTDPAINREYLLTMAIDGFIFIDLENLSAGQIKAGPKINFH